MSSLVSKSLKILAAALMVSLIAADGFAAETGRPNRAGQNRAAPAPAAEESAVERVGIRMAGGMAPAGAITQTTPLTTSVAIVPASAPSQPAEFSSKDGTIDECKDNYFNCMDQFCLLDDSEGERCVCSSKISEFDKTIATIKKLQADAEHLMNEGVEREMLGAKADLAFAATNPQKKKTLDLSFDGDDDIEYTGADSRELTRRGADLYDYASKSCKDRLDRCGQDAEMVKTLYGQQVARDCSAFSKYVEGQKKMAEDNKLAAEREVRKSRVENLDKTNRFNRGECLLALKDCVATKGGCGTNFENCLDASLLARRTNACENILEQCMAVRTYVEKDWKEEQVAVLAEANKFADKNRRGTCLARVDACLEESCAPTINDQCLTDVRIARGVCPVMDECDQMVPGISKMYDSRLGFMRVRFCQNDLSGCFQDKCGENFSNPACVGKSVGDIGKMCPQNMFPSCAAIPDFNAIQAGVVLQVDFQLMQGCINAYAEKLNATCGMDMNCLDENLGAPLDIKTIRDLDEYDYKPAVNAAVDKFFKTLEADPTLVACKGKMGQAVFSTSKLMGRMLAEQRASRNFVRRMAELTKAADVETARKQCESLGKKGANSEGSTIESATFEPSLRNCHICRVESVQERGGQSTGAGAMQGAAGGLAAGAAIGTKIAPGWGSAIGGAIGGVAGGLLGGLSSKETTFEQKLTSCEDVNM
ncbi:MAG: hypothetical protein LBG89_03395 [Rickettsiales bacterium]|jgi:hypothetical protein|nr:hypothetical protein [Rickettsiales bacterium]